MGLKIEMDVLQRYYKINKTLMSSIGQWPYQSRRARNGFTTILLILFASQCVPIIIAAVKYRHDSEVFFECVPPLIVLLACLAKLINCIVNSNKMRALLNSMAKNWKVWAHDQEIAVLHEYSETGRRMTIAYAGLMKNVTMYSTAMIFLSQPIVPKIIDVFLYNGTEPGEFPFPAYYYGVDKQKYYFYVIGHMYIGISTAITILIAGDTMFIVHVHHCCGIFAAVGRKLERVDECNRLRERRRSAFQYLAACIDRHNEGIEFAKLIEAAYSGCFLFVVGLNMLIMSATALQILTKSKEPQDTIRFIVFVGAQMVHLFIETYISQILIDHSIGIGASIQNGKWYETSLKSQQLIQLILMRSIKPCKVTAGKICVMSIETFGAVVKTSGSYFTLLRTMQ